MILAMILHSCSRVQICKSFMGEERSPERAPKHALMTVVTPQRKGKEDGCVLGSCPYSWPSSQEDTCQKQKHSSLANCQWSPASNLWGLKNTKTLISSFSNMAPSSPLVMRAICWYIHRVYPLSSLLCDQEHKELKKKKVPRITGAVGGSKTRQN